MPGRQVAPLTISLREAPFPISHAELVRRYGNITMELDNGDKLTLETALTRIAQPKFQSISDLALAIGEISQNRNADF